MERALASRPPGYLHLRLAGDPERRPTVAFIHQSPSSGRMWLPVMEQLAPEIRTCAIDLFGYGESDPPQWQLSLEEHAEHVVAAIRDVTDGPLVVVGHHTGAVLAAQVAASEPDLVRGLMLSGYPYYPDWQTKFSRLGPALRPADISREGTELLDIWRYVTGPLEDDPDPDVALTIMADRLRAGRQWFTGYVQLLGADLPAILDRAATVAPSRPTSILTADRDPLRGFAAAVAARFGVEPVSIAGTSWVSYEHPERMAEPIAELVARVRA
ncbi:alpha/beta fold hydrolase [Egicoccus sp. AB-alg2]|uniref:alpha/beta fold hydrolase n=1 Tax=Egicoccus sp. AB-alg2 TaxID=3242693 RepID=UPI00359DBC62